jgi:hypothetical protein
MNLKSLFTTALKVAEVVAPFVPPGDIQSGINLVTKIAAGIEKASPDAEALYSEIQAAGAGSPAPSEEKMVAWNARADQIHAAIQAL